MNVQLEAEVKYTSKKHKRAHNKRSNPHHFHTPSDEIDVLIEAINSADLGWKADTCKMQQNHKMYCQENDMVLVQADSSEDKAANQSSSNQTKFDFGEGPGFKKALEAAQKFQQYSAYTEIPDSELPEQFDWRDVEGYDFTGKIRDQSGCGSCYTIAFTQAVEARMQIKYGEKAPQMSPQFLLSCNYMTEGCEGGWPHLHSYLAENGFLVSE